MEQAAEQVDLTQFPVCARKQGKYFYVYYHVIPHPRIFGEVIFKPTGESTNGINPRNKYEPDSQALRTLRLVLKHQDLAIENFKKNLKEIAAQRLRDLTEAAKEDFSGLDNAAGSLIEPGPEEV